MNHLKNKNAGGWGRAPGEDPSARVLKTPLLAVLEALRFETFGEVDLRALEMSAWESMIAVVKTWAYNELDFDREFCSFHENCVGSGIGFKHYYNTFCLGVLSDGKHIHADVAYGYSSDRVYFNVFKVYLGDEDEV